jgi:drug/metabolite transporter (DMT)-like permease
MQRRYALMLAALALIWGSSFMFIKIAVRELAPSTMVAGRVGLAAVALALVVPVRLGGRATLATLRRYALPLAVVGLVNTAVPFWLLTWGETRVDSGLAAIIQAAVPIFMAVFAFGFFPDERVTGMRLAGLLVGFVGVALLVGAQPKGQLLGALAVVGMATFYAMGGLLAGRYLREAAAPVVALATTSVAALALIGPGVAQAPHGLPSWKATASVVVLALVCTAAAYLLFFAIVAGAGAARAGLVTYLVPPIAIAYGALFLDERISASAVVAFVLILSGVGLASRARSARPRAAAPAPPRLS